MDVVQCINEKTEHLIVTYLIKPSMLVLSTDKYKELVYFCNNYYMNLSKPYPPNKEDIIKDISMFTALMYSLPVVEIKDKEDFIEVYGNERI